MSTPTRIVDGVPVHPSHLRTFTVEPGSVAHVVVSQTLNRHTRNVERMHRVAQAQHPATKRMLSWIAEGLA